jgi:hypothetical protein
MPKHSELTTAQRRDAVLALLRREEPAVQLARRWGISEQTERLEWRGRTARHVFVHQARRDRHQGDGRIHSRARGQEVP